MNIKPMRRALFPMTVAAVVRETRIPRPLVQKAVDIGEIPSFEVAGRVRIDRRSLDRYLEERLRKAQVFAGDPEVLVGAADG